MGKLSHKIAVVTGGTSGIGRGIAEQYLRYGATVLVIDNINTDCVEKESPFKYYQTDVTDEKQIIETARKIIKSYGHVDILAYVSMYGQMLPFEDSGSIQLRDKTFSVNLNGAWNTVSAFIPYMKQHGGSVVLVGSSTGFLVADSGETAYAASKAALVGLTKALAVEYAPYNIRVNTICQGYIQTQLCEQAAYDMNPQDPQKVLNAIADKIPMKRLGTCKEVGEAAAFLSCDESSYITGIQLVIDGGNSLPETNSAGA